MDVRSFSSFHTHTLRSVMFQNVVAWSKKYGCTCTKTIICKEPLRIGEAIRQQNHIGVFAHRMCIQILFVHNTLCIPVYMYTCTCTPVCTSAVRTFWKTQIKITANKATCTCMLNYHQFISEKTAWCVTHAVQRKQQTPTYSHVIPCHTKNMTPHQYL